MGEVSKLHPQPFTSYEALYRRLKQMVDAKFLKRDVMLHNGEYYFYLAPKGIAFLEGEGFTVPPRAKQKVGISLQRHEFEVSRFLIKFYMDCQKISLPTIAFWRDGSFRASVTVRGQSQVLVPDGTILLRVKGYPRLFFLEIDRSTEMAVGFKGSHNTFHGKLERYLAFLRTLKAHPDLKSYHLPSFRVMVVCTTEERLVSLRSVARNLGIRNLVAFTCWPRITTQTDHTTKGWDYRSTNILSAHLFAYPGRSPPGRLL